MQKEQYEDGGRNWLRTAIVVHDESRHPQIRAKCSCLSTKQSSHLLRGLRCQRLQDSSEFPSIWGRSALLLQLCQLQIISVNSSFSVNHGGTCFHLNPLCRG